MTATYVDTRDVPIARLTRFPGNAKHGDVDKIRESVRRNGQYRALVVREVGAELVILAGNHTRDALAAEGHATARCEIITCDEMTARRINLADNKMADLGSYDHDALAELLSSLDDDLDGTGYTHEDLEKLLGPADRLPEPGDAETDEDLPNAWGVIITCADESEQAELLHRFSVEGLSVRALSL